MTTDPNYIAHLKQQLGALASSAPALPCMTEDERNAQAWIEAATATMRKMLELGVATDPPSLPGGPVGLDEVNRVMGGGRQPMGEAKTSRGGGSDVVRFEGRDYIPVRVTDLNESPSRTAVLEDELRRLRKKLKKAKKRR